MTMCILSSGKKFDKKKMGGIYRTALLLGIEFQTHLFQNTMYEETWKYTDIGTLYLVNNRQCASSP